MAAKRKRPASWQQRMVGLRGSTVQKMRELIMDIMKYGSDCEVLKPSTLRRAVRQELAKALERYSGKT